MHDELFSIFGSIGLKNTKANKAIDQTVGKAEKAGAGITNAFKKAAVAIGGIFAAKKLFDFGSATVQAASDVEEMENKFNVVFSGMQDTVNEWANNYADSIGRNRNQIKGYLADNQNMFVGMGMTREAGANLSEQLVAMAIDLASFNNLNEDDAVNAMSKAVMGESEAAKALGVVLNENTLAMAQEALGYKGKFQNLTEAEKMQVRYQAIVMQSTDAVGDAERSLDSYKGQQIMLNAAIENVKESLGKLLMPLFKFGVAIAGDGVAKIQGFVDKMSESGITLDGFVEKIKGGATIVKDVAKKAYDYFNDNLRPGIEKFGKLIRDNAPKIREVIEDTIKKIIEAAQNIWDFYQENLKPVIDEIIKAVMEMAPEVQKIVIGVIDAVLEQVEKFKKFFDDKVMPLIKDFLEYIKKHIPTLKKIWITTFKAVVEVLEKFWEFISDYILPILESMYDFFVEYILPIIQAFIDVLLENLPSAITFVSEFISSLIDFFGGVVEIVESVITWIGDLITKFGEFVDGAKELPDKIKEQFDLMSENIYLVIDGLIEDAINWGKNMIDELVKGIEGKVEEVKTAASNVAQAIKDFLGFSSPTKEGPGSSADKWMPNLINMLADGLKKGAPKVSKATEKIAQTVDAFIGFGEGISQGAAAGYGAYGANFIEALASGIKRGTNSIGAAMQVIADAIDKSVRNIVSNMQSKMDLEQSKFELKMLQNRDLEDTERGYQMQIDALVAKQNSLAAIQKETQKARNLLVQTQGEDSAAVLEYDQELINLQIERTKIFNEIEDYRQKIKDLANQAAEAAEEESKSKSKSKSKSSSGFVKMWTGDGYATVNEKYVDKYKDKGYTTDLPSQKEIDDMIKKASDPEKYARGGILTKPTAFGFNPFSGKTMVGGEAGAEAIAPIETLKSYISEAVDKKESESVAVLKLILKALVNMDDSMAEKFKDALDSSSGMSKRELRRLVGAL